MSGHCTKLFTYVIKYQLVNVRWGSEQLCWSFISLRSSCKCFNGNNWRKRLPLTGRNRTRPRGRCSPGVDLTLICFTDCSRLALSNCWNVRFYLDLKLVVVSRLSLLGFSQFQSHFTSRGLNSQNYTVSSWIPVQELWTILRSVSKLDVVTFGPR